MVKTMMILFAVIFTLYLLSLLFLFLTQTSFIFNPRKITAAYAVELRSRYPQAEEFTIEAFDQKKLHGWFIKKTEGQKVPLLIYFGGNKEEVSHLLGHVDQFSGYALGLVNYRGYGLSEGAPNEYLLSQDAEKIYDTLVSRPDITPDKIVVMGRSLGTGVAIQLASTRPVAGIILVTPYDSLVSVAQERLKIFPVSLFMTTRFDSLAKAPALKAPMLALVARHDRTIPKWHADRLVENWGGTTKVKIFEEAGHSTIQKSPGYWEEIGQFLSQL